MTKLEDATKNKRFRCERFHSRLLIPYEVAQKAIDQDDIEPILLWIDAFQTGYKFKEGQEVAHKDNPLQKMYVQKIMVANISLESGAKFSKMIGILCHWWENCPCVEGIDYTPSDIFESKPEEPAGEVKSSRKKTKAVK